MVRGNAKIESQKKAQKKLEDSKKPGSQLDARKAALKISCPKCLVQLTSYLKLKEHYDAKHPKDPVPPEEQFK